ncbi:MAG: alpha-L-fucosidase [Bacteroidales bacterium]|nr:alpha-L-fucosidase [Bacteroidales bacterium]
MNIRRLFLWAITGLLFFPAMAQQEKNPETNPLIVNRLNEWQDLKFGFMMHWGMYAQWGVVESWSICNEPWIDRKGVPYTEYKEQYQALNKTFNPKHFQPETWATLAQEAGMKYVVFTTKHHDGFCMFDTKETDYSASDPSCPFSTNHLDITAEVVNAFRNKGFWTGLYFSKADWHHPDYWAPEWATPDRNVNYDPALHPDRWQRFCNFTFKQIKELTTNYGNIDILWLDGGWIRPEWSVKEEYRPWLGCQGWIQDIEMPTMAAMARSDNPDLLIVDRTVHGQFENYQTPEQLVPDSLLPYPWETCMTMGNSWSYVENDQYKSARQLIHLLIDIVAKGGNFLLNVGPDSDGNLPPTAVERLKEIGQWMKINGDAIYATRPIFPYSSEKLRFTQDKNGKIFAFYLCDEAEILPKTIKFQGLENLKTGSVSIKGTTAKATLKKTEQGYQLSLSNAALQKIKSTAALVFELNR